MKALAIFLIVLGALALAYKGISYTKHKEVLNIGPIEASVDEKKTIPLSPIVGIVAVVAGAALLFNVRGRA
jgi:hypothetical protein